jgi:hypothetical protein
MHLYEVQTASCPSSAAIEFAETFFIPSSKTSPANSGREPRWPLPACEVIIDYTDSARRHDALKLRWAQRAFLLPPGFEGFLTVRPTRVRSRLTLEGIFRSQLRPPANSLDVRRIQWSFVLLCMRYYEESFRTLKSNGSSL